MSDTERLKREKLVEIHRAGSEWEGNWIVSYLAASGVEAALRLPAGDPLLDALEIASGADKACGIFVLEHDADRGTALVKELLEARTDEAALDQAAGEIAGPGESGDREEKA